MFFYLSYFGGRVKPRPLELSQPDDKTGEKVCVYIVVNQDVSSEQIINHCREYLTRYKVPKNVMVLNELPKSTVGKILRKELRKQQIETV